MSNWCIYHQTDHSPVAGKCFWIGPAADPMLIDIVGNRQIDDRNEVKVTVGELRALYGQGKSDGEGWWKSLLETVLTGAEYDRMEAEGAAAEALGMVWHERDDRWVHTGHDDE